jgi:hypothetical protein
MPANISRWPWQRETLPEILAGLSGILAGPYSQLTVSTNRIGMVRFMRRLHFSNIVQ